MLEQAGCPYSTISKTAEYCTASSTAFQSPSANAAVTSGAGDNNGYQTTASNAYADDNLYATLSLCPQIRHEDADIV